jgi:hypothetical protein
MRLVLEPANTGFCVAVGSCATGLRYPSDQPLDGDGDLSCGSPQSVPMSFAESRWVHMADKAVSCGSRAFVPEPRSISNHAAVALPRIENVNASSFSAVMTPCGRGQSTASFENSVPASRRPNC